MTIYEFLSQNGIKTTQRQRSIIGHHVKNGDVRSEKVERLEPVMVCDYPEEYLCSIKDKIIDIIGDIDNYMPKRKKDDFVYVLKCGGFIRVGYTVSIEQTVEKLRKSLKDDVVVLFCDSFIGGNEVSHNLRERISEYRCKNSNLPKENKNNKWWFKLTIGQSDKLIKTAKSLKSTK